MARTGSVTGELAPGVPRAALHAWGGAVGEREVAMDSEVICAVFIMHGRALARVKIQQAVKEAARKEVVV